MTPCVSTRYTILGSSSALNPTAFPHLPAKDLIQLDISFGRLEINNMEQSFSKTIAQMIADMGGQVNLWMGASMITLIEFPVMLVAYCCYRLYRKVVDSLFW